MASGALTLPPRLADLRFVFGTRRLKPKTFWHCEETPESACDEPCGHATGRWVVDCEDGVHITLELEHGHLQSIA